MTKLREESGKNNLNTMQVATRYDATKKLHLFEGYYSIKTH